MLLPIYLAFGTFATAASPLFLILTPVNATQVCGGHTNSHNYNIVLWIPLHDVYDVYVSGGALFSSTTPSLAHRGRGDSNAYD